MGSILSLVSSVMYLSEKMTLYATCAGLICCLVLTITVTLGMGVGLGYNYCFVDLKTRYKYIKWHYIYPNSPRWPYRRNIAEQGAFDEIAEDEELRMGPPQPDDIPPDQITSTPDDIDTRVLREFLRYNGTGNGTATDYYPTFPDSESLNGTESSVKTSVDASKNEEVIETTENSPEANSHSNTTASTNKDETDVVDETDEPTPEPSIVNDEQPQSSSSSRRIKKLVIPISGLDLISLLSKLKAENKNYSLQIVTT